MCEENKRMEGGQSERKMEAEKGKGRRLPMCEENKRREGGQHSPISYTCADCYRLELFSFAGTASLLPTFLSVTVVQILMTSLLN